MDKERILKTLTKEWQSTKQISKELNAGNQNIIQALYELLVDDKKVRRKVMPYGKNLSITYWRLK